MKKSALFGLPTFDPAQLSPTGQAALGSYQAALAKVLDTSRRRNRLLSQRLQHQQRLCLRWSPSPGHC